MKSFLIEVIQNKNVNEWNSFSFFSVSLYICFFFSYMNIALSRFIFLLNTFPFPFFFFNFGFLKEIKVNTAFHIRYRASYPSLGIPSSYNVEPNVKCQEVWKKWRIIRPGIYSLLIVGKIKPKANTMVSLKWSGIHECHQKEPSEEREAVELTISHRIPREGRFVLGLGDWIGVSWLSQILQEPCVLCYRLYGWPWCEGLVCAQVLSIHYGSIANDHVPTASWCGQFLLSPSSCPLHHYEVLYSECILRRRAEGVPGFWMRLSLFKV